MMSGFATRGLGLFQRPRDVPLLSNRKNVVHQPVKHETAREAPEEEGEHHGHDGWWRAGRAPADSAGLHLPALHCQRHDRRRGEGLNPLLEYS